MFDSVVRIFAQRFTRPLEGYARNPYLDVEGFATVAEGILCNTPALWRPLKWKLQDGSPASVSIVDQQMRSLIAQQDLKNYRFDSPRVLAATSIRLDDSGIDEAVNTKLAQNWRYMLTRFPAIDTWPADAQLFACSLAWAEGPGWDAENPNLTRVLRLSTPNFGAAIEHAPDSAHPGQYLAAAADISTKGNPGIVPRNAQNELALSNADAVQRLKLDYSVLHWPKSPFNDGSAAI